MASGYFRGKTALVTGAGSGIGAALVRRLAARGAHVVAADRDAAALARTVDGVEPGSIETALLDVTDAAAFKALVDRIPRLDLLYNNAGVGLAGEVRDVSLADWRRVIEVNLWGVIHGIDAAYPRMVEQRSGQIINTASGAGLMPRPGMTPYATTKHAVVGLSTSLRAEASAFGVGVSAVCPGHIATGIIAATTYRKLDKDALVAAIPTKGMSADACAGAMLRGTERDRAIIVVGALTRLEWWLYRISPALVVRLSRIRGDLMRARRVG